MLRCKGFKPGATRDGRLRGLLTTSLVALLALGGCSHAGMPGDGLPKEVTDVLPLGEKHALEVAMASPQGSLDSLTDTTSIVVAFNQPMVPLQPVPTALMGSLLKIQPPIAGRYVWKGTATLTFEPQGPLPYGTHYSVTVPAGTKAWSGEQLAKDYAFEFDTPAPALERSVPANGNSKVSANSHLFLHFNQPMSAETMIDLADTAMYEAKAHGRDCFRIAA